MSFTLPNNLANELSNGILRNKEKLIIREYQRALGNIRSQLQNAYSKYGVKGSLSLEVMSKYGRLEKMEEAITGEMNRVLSKTGTHVKSSVKGSFKSTYYANNYLISEGSNANFNMAILNEKKVQAAINNKYDRIGWPARLKDNVEQTTKQVRSEITQGVIQGYPYQKVSQRISDRLGIGAYKSHRIVRTESHRAQEMGHRQTRQELSRKTEDMKAEIYKIWDAALDLRTRPEHGALDGQEVKQKDNFELGGYSAPAPGLFGVAYMDINCRCTTRTKVKHPDLEYQEPEITYSDWYESKFDKKAPYTKRVPVSEDKKGFYKWSGTPRNVNTIKRDMKDKLGIKKISNNGLNVLNKDMMVNINEMGRTLTEDVVGRFPYLQKLIKNGDLSLDEMRFDFRNRFVTGLKDGSDSFVSACFHPLDNKISFADDVLSRPVDEILTIGGERTTGCVGGTARHEFAHKIWSDAVTQSNLEDVVKFRRSWESWFADTSDDFIWENISAYAKTNHKEAFAEALSAYTSPKYNGELPNEVEDLILQFLGE